jgi:ketosteroid isomerase-like protein
MVDRKTVERILETYEEAWVGQDIKKILSIFKKGGVYHERVLKRPFKGHKEIAEYWKTKVVEEQSDIKFKLLNYYICGDVVIAEWDASFNSNIEKARIHMREVAILEIKDNKIKSLREYWQSERI